MKLAAFSITPPETASEHIHNMIAMGAFIVPGRIMKLKPHPGGCILCPQCFNGLDLKPVWHDTIENRAIAYVCPVCNTQFDRDEELHLVSGHLAPF